MTTELTCVDCKSTPAGLTTCGKPAVWVRDTQFAGEHHYCQEHAEQQEDFLEADSYSHWYKLKQD